MTSGLGRLARAALLVALAPLALAGAGGAAAKEMSASDMRQACRGIAAAKVSGNSITIDARRYPQAAVCWGAFDALHQEGLHIYPNGMSVFLPGVCLAKGGHGQKALVMIDMFTRYVDEHPKEAGKDFVGVAWQAFRHAWPCASH